MGGYLRPPAADEPSDSLDFSSGELGDLVFHALAEDLGQGDLTTRVTLPGAMQAQGTFNSKQRLVLAGLPIARKVFEVLDSSLEWQDGVEEGTEVTAGSPLASIRGAAGSLLAGERVALNFLQHLSGIATFARRLKEELAGTRAEFLDTRKTTPGLRTLQKYAVRVGGGQNHRLRLDDGILIKGNHLRLVGGIRTAVESALRQRPVGYHVEVEITSREEMDEAIAAGADGVLLDNMSPAEVRECVQRAGGRVRLEVSGGIDARNIRAYAEAGVDYISVGALTHSAAAVDINFRVAPLAE
ncbi:MAG: carboxylating nicotinate-nucleotide diphosphorylase [Terriglobia bacterium]